MRALKGEGFTMGSNVFNVDAAEEALAGKIKPTGKLPVAPIQNR